MSPLGQLGRRLVAACPFLLLFGAAALASALPDAFVLTREGLAHGEAWRLWTGHLVHASWAHFLLDVGAGLVLLFLAREWKFLLWAAPVASVAILLAEPGLEGYCGLSGLLHGWTILAAALVVADRRSGAARWIAASLAIGVLAKAAYEATLGVSIFTTDAEMGVPTVHAAHLIGALLGVVALGWRSWQTGRRAIRCASPSLSSSSSSPPAPRRIPPPTSGRLSSRTQRRMTAQSPRTAPSST